MRNIVIVFALSIGGVQASEQLGCLTAMFAKHYLNNTEISKIPGKAVAADMKRITEIGPLSAGQFNTPIDIDIVAAIKKETAVVRGRDVLDLSVRGAGVAELNEEIALLRKQIKLSQDSEEVFLQAKRNGGIHHMRTDGGNEGKKPKKLSDYNGCGQIDSWRYYVGQRSSEWTPEDIRKTLQAFKADRKQKRDRIKIAGLEIVEKNKAATERSHNKIKKFFGEDGPFIFYYCHQARRTGIPGIPLNIALSGRLLTPNEYHAYLDAKAKGVVL